MLASKETVHRYHKTERIRYGASFISMLANEISSDEARRAFVVAAPQLSGTDSFEQLKVLLGTRFCGEFSNIPAHVPSSALFDGVRAAREAKADLIIVLGGGSAIDTAKLISLCLAYDIDDIETLARHSDLQRYDPSSPPAEAIRWVRSIAVPTTLSAAEFTWYAGVTDESLNIKRVVGHPLLIPRTVLYDPELTMSVPLPIFLASGIKAIDHAAERIASLAAQPYSDAVSKEALQILARSLPQVAADPGDLQARLDCQLAAWLSILGGNSGVRVGASHAIGHMLGPHASIPHGYTSCTILASVMRWNKPANHHRQRIISAALGRDDLDAGDAIERLVSSLNLPTRLRDVNLDRSELRNVARKTMEDSSISTNPRKISNEEDILEILEMAY
jgi:maleylacetate reductase